MTSQPPKGSPQSVAEPAPFWRKLDRVLDTLALICVVITGVAMVVLTVIFGWLVYGRYIENSTPTWVEQAALLLVMLIAFLGAAVGVHQDTHLSVTVFRTAVPTWLRRVLVLATDIIMAGFGFLMVWFGTRLTIFKWGSDIPLIHVPEGLRSLPLTVGGGLILLFAVGHLMRNLRGVDMRTDEIG